MRLTFFISLILFVFSFTVSAQWHVILTEIPSNTPVDGPIFIAGNFNQWNPGHSDYQLKKDDQGRWNIKLNISAGNLQFKFTRGSWATVEGNSEGKVIANRTFQYIGGQVTSNLKILGWEDMAGQNMSTASPQVSVMSAQFPMPQLNTTRKIWVYLPKDYHGSQKSYPVLYMHDGQNLFDKTTSFLNEWRVDESLDSLYNLGDYGCIVIGIDNGGANRIKEYTPWPHPSYGGGDGEKYVRFITESLKPYVDSVYRTKKEPRFTAIAGSSLGGLISHYAGINFSSDFGKIGSLSSSFWFSSHIYTTVSSKGVKDYSCYYLSAGTDESATQVFDVQRMADTLRAAGIADRQLEVSIVQGGKHNEFLWAKEFPKMYQWFWKDEDFTSSVDSAPEKPEKFTVARFSDSIRVTGEQLATYLYSIHLPDGRNIQTGILQENIPVPETLRQTLLLFSIQTEKGILHTFKLP